MQRVCIISTGTELMLGTTIDSNANFLSQRLTDLGFKVVTRYTVGDSEEYIREAFTEGLRQADLVVSSGGLGPTLDDLTKQTACQVLGVQVVLNEEEVQRLRDFFRRRNREMPEANLKQAMFPPEALILPNQIGTAPGMYIVHQGKAVALLPGPPREMEHMYWGALEPVLKKEFATVPRVARKTIKVLGPGESQVEALLGSLMEQPDYSIALLAKDGEVHVKVSAEAKDLGQAEAIRDQAVSQVEAKLAPHVFGYDEDTLEGRVAVLLGERALRLATAESCTGGLLAKVLTDIPGSSSYFWGSVCSYSNEAKEVFLEVSPDTLNRFGAVSQETATEMAMGLRGRSGVDYTLSITGIAGPGGGSAEKPVGLVFIGLAGPEGCTVKELRFVGPREAIRILAVKSALDLLRRQLVVCNT
ncbi:MAG: competence/damage-inducible protein A [Syntrophomonadaceae bacterium]